MSKITILLAISFLFGIPAILPAQKVGTLDLEKLVGETIQNNPQLRAARNEKSAARAKTGQATAWDAPQVGVEFFQTPVQSFPNPLKNGVNTEPMGPL